MRDSIQVDSLTARLIDYSLRSALGYATVEECAFVEMHKGVADRVLKRAADIAERLCMADRQSYSALSQR